MVIPLIFPKVPQSSQTEFLGFPSFLLPLNTPGTLKNPTTPLDLATQVTLHKEEHWYVIGSTKVVGGWMEGGHTDSSGQTIQVFACDKIWLP